MSTLNTATLHSDDEDDGDFVPTASPRKIKKRRINPSKRSKTEDGSESDSSSGTSGEDEPNIDDEETKKLKVEQVEAEALIRKQKAAEMFASMREEVSTPVLSGSKGSEEKKSSVEMVEIRRPRQFAGETIYETVSLPKDDPEVVAFLARRPKIGIDSEAGPTNVTSVPSSNSVNLDVKAVSASSSTPIQAPAAPVPPVRKGPPKRKPRQSLEAMSAALDKGKKMTTLEKSQMDWKSATSSDPSVQAELEANRRGGGYLEKQQFLDRVGDRRTGTFDSRKGR